MTIAYLTDVEGLWSKITDFARENPVVTLVEDGEGRDRLDVAPGHTFVFGGDAIDRGPAGRRIVKLLLDAKERQPDRVVLLAGNRDINKMRLVRELCGAPPVRTPPEVARAGGPALLRWIFAETMGAKIAFEMRQTELGDAAAAEDVVRSFLDDLAPDGDLSRYLAACQLAFRAGETLFVHGAVTEENLGVVPETDGALRDVGAWIEALNAFHARAVRAFRERRIEADGTSGWSALVAYQAPVAGTRLNQRSVVYGRPADALGNPVLPSEAVIERLRESAISRVIVGHTPSGDGPSILAAPGFTLVLADSSYSRLEHGALVLVDDDVVRVRGRAAMDAGDEHALDFSFGPRDDDRRLGRRDARNGRLLKAKMAGGHLAFRFLPGFATEQIRVTEDDAPGDALVVPHAAPTSEI